jgi:tetratricopeptide (TPR) repeat protein
MPRSLAMPDVPFAWERFPWAEALNAYTRALGAARTGDQSGAEREIARLRALEDKLVASQDKYWADQVEVQRLAAAGMAKRAQGNDAEAVRLVRAAADLEGGMDKHPVTPAAILPARELLADLLLELDRPADAVAEYQRSLAAEPKRFRRPSHH